MLRKKRAITTDVGRLKKTLMYVNIEHLTYVQWVNHRKHYIGGSDVPTILPGNLNPYQSKLELYHQKVGVVESLAEETEATYSGHCMEDYIVDNYWIWHNMASPDHETRMKNKDLGKQLGRQRYRKKVKDVMIYDPRHPHVQINVDGFIQNTRFEKAPRGILECKSGLGYVWNEYEAGIPVFNIIQAQAYMGVTGLKYCEIAVLLDGRYFKVFPIEGNKAIQDKIFEECKIFWDLVLEGRQIWEDPDLDDDEKIQYLNGIEPEVDGSMALDKYLKKRFRSDYKAGQMMVTPQILKIAKQYLDCNKALNATTLIKTKHSNALKKIFLDNKVDEVIDSEQNIIITNRLVGKATTPTLKVKPEAAKLIL